MIKEMLRLPYLRRFSPLFPPCHADFQIRRGKHISFTLLLRSAATSLLCLNALTLPPIACTQGLPASKRRSTTFAYVPAPERGMPLVRIRIQNGARSETMATFVIDTGFTDCMMSDRLARLLQMAGEPALRADGSPACFADGRPLQQVISSVQVGSFLTEQCRFLLLKAYRLDLLDCPSHGILGWHFFWPIMRRCSISRRIRSRSGMAATWSADEINAAGMQDAILLPRANDAPGRFDVRVRLDDRLDTTLSVDTGGARHSDSP